LIYLTCFSNKDSAKENTVCVEIDTVHQKKRKKVREVEVIHGNGKETNESSDVLQVDSKKRGKKRKNRSVSPEKNQGNHLVVDEPLAKSKAEKKKKAPKRLHVKLPLSDLCLRRNGRPRPASIEKTGQCRRRP